MMRTPDISPELAAALRRLKLGRILDTLPERLVLAEKQKMCTQDLLLLILSDEIHRRNSSAIARKVQAAKLDLTMTLDQFDASANITYNKQLFNELCSLRFLEAHKHVNILGPVGVGKTFVANAIGHIACAHGYDVFITRADDMLRSLRQSRFDNSRDQKMLELTTVDLLIVDDFALDQMTKDQSSDIYQLLVERTGRNSMIVTSNRDTGEWLAMFDDTLRAQSAIDRFINAAYDLVIEGESYRPRQKPKLAVDAEPPPPPAIKSRRSRRRKS